MKIKRKIKNLYSYFRDWLLFKKMHALSLKRFSLYWKDRWPCLGEDTKVTGFDRHYIYHPAWAARVLADTRPEYHVDISSTLHFCTLISAFIPVRFFDFRPAALDLRNLCSGDADLLNLPFEDNSLPSLSCMHVIEHIGLGRYGDNLDPDGDLKAIAEVQRVLAPNGSFLFVVPVGMPKIRFNGLRIYSYEQIINYFSGFELRQFALIPDRSIDGDLVYDASPEMANAQTYGCGCFWFVKKAWL